jgi:hypothetical protein
MKSHSCSKVRGVVAIVFTHSDCDYGPSKVMPFMIPMGQSDRRPLLVHGFTLSALNTRVEVPDRDAEHQEDPLPRRRLLTALFPSEQDLRRLPQVSPPQARLLQQLLSPRLLEPEEQWVCQRGAGESDSDSTGKG